MVQLGAGMCVTPAQKGSYKGLVGLRLLSNGDAFLSGCSTKWVVQHLPLPHGTQALRPERLPSDPNLEGTSHTSRNPQQSQSNASQCIA